MSSLPGRRLFVYPQDAVRKPQGCHTACHVRRFHLRDLVSEDPFCHRKLLPHDRNRAWSHSIRAMFRQYPGDHCPDLPGNPAGSRRIDHIGGQYIFHGCCRPSSYIWNLQTLPETLHKPQIFHFSGSGFGRSFYLLHHQRAAWPGLSF